MMSASTIFVLFTIETVARKYAQAVELFGDIQCGAVDAENLHDDGGVETFAARLHDLWVSAPF